MIVPGKLTVREGSSWHCKSQYQIFEAIKADTEADARIKMLIYLIETKLMGMGELP